MKKKLVIPVLLVILLAALVLILPRVAVRTQEISPDPPAESKTEEAEEVYVLSLKEELPGEYVLTALFSDGLRLSEAEIAPLRERGIPLGLSFREDGTVTLTIFDTVSELEADTDAMFFFGGGQAFPFFYQDGVLTVWDSGSRAVFQKAA
jgi:hypothetical protein